MGINIRIIAESDTPTRGDIIAATVNLFAAMMMTYITTDDTAMAEFQQWLTDNPDVIPEFFHREDVTPEFLNGAAEAFTRIAMGEDPEHMR